MAFGEKDRAVPLKESVERIQLHNNGNITVKVYPKLGHGMAEPVAPGIYRMSEEFLRNLVDFIKNRE